MPFYQTDLDELTERLARMVDEKPGSLPVNVSMDLKDGTTMTGQMTAEPTPVPLAEAFPPLITEAAAVIATAINADPKSPVTAVATPDSVGLTPVLPLDSLPDPTEGERLLHVYDIKNVAWDEALHAGTADKPIKKADGTWRARRGATKKTPVQGVALAGAELPMFNAMMANLIGLGVEPGQILESVSQAVFGDLSKTDGGIIHVQTAGDPKATGKAISCLRAIAADGGHEI